jgi:hypothetical protein
MSPRPAICLNSDKTLVPEIFHGGSGGRSKIQTPERRCGSPHLNPVGSNLIAVNRSPTIAQALRPRAVQLSRFCRRAVLFGSGQEEFEDAFVIVESVNQIAAHQPGEFTGYRKAQVTRALSPDIEWVSLPVVLAWSDDA